ncbi:MAG: HAMP domain-containing histidine kinase [Nocardiaceae bacterium]|nr:HAMP domain-containing histidine kinase [Nocardiaceae bacterium]
MSSTRPRRGTLGLRGRVVVSFSVGAGFISLIIAISVFTLSRSYMLNQRERSAERQASTHAAFVRNSLSAPDASAGRLLATLETPVDTFLLMYWNQEWFSSEPNVGPTDLPAGLYAQTSTTKTESPLTVHTSFHGQPYLAIAIPLDDKGATLYELAPLLELQATLRVLRIVLGVCAAAAALGGAGLGLWASRRVLTPLHQLGETSARIAGGDLDSRLPPTGDRELITIVDSFNSMVDSLQQRIERERRFFGDVSHELRTPLTTLIASVGVLVRHSFDLPDRSQRALSLITAELDHLRRLLDDLLALARIEAGLHQDPLEQLSLEELLTNTIESLRHPAELLEVEADSVVSGRKKALERAFLNLIANADRHGDGLTKVTLTSDVSSRTAVIFVDDSGPGVSEEDRTRIFERFATGHTSRKTVSGTGTGLGLALVTETVAAHGGGVTCTTSPFGGARFVVTLPAIDEPRADSRPGSEP